MSPIDIEADNSRPLPLAASSTVVRGRSPGSEVLTHRLPKEFVLSGFVMRPHFLTVAGAAQA